MHLPHSGENIEQAITQTYFLGEFIVLSCLAFNTLIFRSLCRNMASLGSLDKRIG